MLIDTSGFFAVYSKNDKNHSQAGEIYQKSRLRVTTNYVLAEYVALSLIRSLPRNFVLVFSQEILSDKTVEIFWVDEDLHRRAVELLQRREDKNYSLCDADSFVIMNERNIREALTTDKHFEQENFVRLLKP